MSADRVRELCKKIYEQVQKDLERDTAKLDTINYNIMAYYKNGGLFIEMQRSDSTISKPVEVDVVVDKISEPKSKLDNIWEKIKLFSVWVLVLLIVVHVLRRVADKTLS